MVLGPGPIPLVGKLSLAGEILIAYGRVRWWLWRVDFRRTVHALRESRGRRLPVAGSPAYAGARLGGAVVRTLRLLPTDSRCLMRSLVLTALLTRRGIDSRLVLGVRRDEDFAAHAWVEHAGVPLLDPGDPGFKRLLEL
jgi:transglutaminase superfamily protein